MQDSLSIINKFISYYFC